MPILVDGKALASDTVNFFTLITQCPALKEASKTFLLRDSIEVTGQSSLYVDQREYAALCPADNHLSIIGSDDATTCHIMFARHTGSNVVACGHFDGCGTKQGVADILNHLMSLSSDRQGKVEVLLFGGFLDDSGLSLKISNSLLDCLHKSSVEIHLLLACITEVNDVLKEDNVHWPIVYGVAYDIRKNEVFPATFASKDPDALLRSARHLTGSQTMVNIYDNKRGLLVIGPFEYGTIRDASTYLSLPDEVIRKFLSTSPQQEPEHFARRIKDTIRFTLAHSYGDSFRGGKARLYYRSNCSWNRQVN